MELEESVWEGLPETYYVVDRIFAGQVVVGRFGYQ